MTLYPVLSSLYGNSPRAPQNLGNAQAFNYQPDAVSDDVQDIAARGVSDFHETECFAQYERDIDHSVIHISLRQPPAPASRLHSMT
ncbi:hypothetical protein [Paraburkholderia sp. 35.1]|uniref:hypothetical protein n=1 Tax=Paraburkholderia sp. 35.1 TaxID=2991058 RepID=UPI003D23E345